MSRRDADRIAALVGVVEALASREPQSLGDLAERIFGWPPDRVFDAIDSALAAKLIAKNPESRAIEVTKAATIPVVRKRRGGT